MTTTDYVDEQISNYSNPPGATGSTGPSGPMSSVSIMNEWISTGNIESGTGYYLSSMIANGTVLVTSNGSNLQVWQLSNENWTMTSSFTLPISGCVSISAATGIDGAICIAVGLPNYNTGYDYYYGYYWNGTAPLYANLTKTYSFGVSNLINTFVGIVQVFQYSSVNGWSQLGSNIIGPETGGGTSFFYPGPNMPQGAPNNTESNPDSPDYTTSKYGPSNYTPPPPPLFGTSVSLSPNGLFLAVGAPLYTFPGSVQTPKTGGVMTYSYISGNWNELLTTTTSWADLWQYGQSDTIYVETPTDDFQQTMPELTQGPPYSVFSTNAYSGCSVAITNLGIPAYGAYGSNTFGGWENYPTPFNTPTVVANTTPYGAVGYNQNVHIYSPYNSSTSGFGLCVATSANGSVIAVGAPYAVPNASSPSMIGSVNIYYTTLAVNCSIINAPIPNTQFGYAVALSADGSLCAIAAPPYNVYFYRGYGKGYFSYGSPIVLPTPMYTTSSTTLSETFTITNPLCISDDGLTISVLDVNGQVYIYSYQRMILQV